MATAEKLGDGSGHDKVTEKRMAELLGTTPKALQRKRERSAIPNNIWSKIDGRIMYSIWRYDEWLESQWSYPTMLSLPKRRSASATPQKKNGPQRHASTCPPITQGKQSRIYILK